MKFDELSVVIPCHGLDDFPTQLQGADAEGLLAGWSALWHPALIAAFGKTAWRLAGARSFPSDSLFGKLLVMPPVVEKSFSGDLVAKAENEGGRVIRGLTDRDEIVAALLAAIADGTDSHKPPIDGELVADFLALGTCYLYSELLVRRMRYVSTLDDGRLQEHVVAAATAAVAGNRDEARHGIELCCNVLVESRGRYYPADTSLVDLTLAAATTIGPSLRHDLSHGQSLNLLISGEVLAEMAAREPESLAMLRAALETANPRMSVCGGEWREVELPLLPLESILAGLQRGLAAYQQHLGRPPTVFARRQHDLTPVLPAILPRPRLPRRRPARSMRGSFRSPTARRRGGRASMGRRSTRSAACHWKPNSPARSCNLPSGSATRWITTTWQPSASAHWPGCNEARSITICGGLRRSLRLVFGKFVALDDYFAGTERGGMYSPGKFHARRISTRPCWPPSDCGQAR